VAAPFVNLNNFDVGIAQLLRWSLFPETSIVGTKNIPTCGKRVDSGSRFRIQFDGILEMQNIWINSFYLGITKVDILA
jgi:beta-galactosidase